MTLGMPPLEGLRERKKQQTRASIARAALELFERQGFNETTIPQIASAADVSPRTVSSYFPAKEDLVFPDTQASFDRLAARLGERRPGETAAEAIRDWITSQLPDWRERDAELRMQRVVVESDQALMAHEQRFRAQGERLVAEAIAADLSASPDELEPRMAAAATFAIFSVLGEHRDGEAEDPAEEAAENGAHLLALLDRALRFVDAGIRALRGDPEDVRADPPISPGTAPASP